MHNKNAESIILKCNSELDKISKIIEGLGKLSNVVPFLTKYAIIKSCGVLEQSLKSIIFDYCTSQQSEQIKNFVDNRFKKSPINPTLDNLYYSLKIFDTEWEKQFKEKVKSLTNNQKLKDSLKSLNEARHSFAHGGNPTTTFDDTIVYFKNSVILIKIIDSIINSNGTGSYLSSPAESISDIIYKTITTNGE